MIPTHPPATASTHSKWRTRATLIGIVVVFFIPVLSAIWLNAYAPHWQPFGYTNHGKLLAPAVSVNAVRLKALDGLALKRDFWRGRWTMVYVASDGCDSRCEQALVRMRQVRLALGKDSDRIQRLLVFTDNQVLGSARIGQLLQKFPGLRIVSIPLHGTMQAVASTDPAAVGTVILVDPRAFAMLRFTTAISASEVLKDMQRLLKLAKRE